MHFTSIFLTLVLALAGPSFATEGTIAPGQGTAIGGALDRTITPGPKGPQPAAAQVAGPLVCDLSKPFSLFQYLFGSDEA